MRNLLIVVGIVGGSQWTPAADPDFARDVLPILSENCFACHGPDANARKADLRLDTEDGLRPASEDLIARITSKDASDVMPPPKAKKTLTTSQIDTLKRWIHSGAAWGKHWAFVPPSRPPLPQLREPHPLLRNPIDHFVFARLAKEGLSLSPEDSKESLIRRVTLDLTGLPPTTAEVDAYLADPSAHAYEKVVDRLLASPHYGERMVWEWLDAARYADSNGYQGDDDRTMWPWRDWAVKAFNADMPFDTFTIWQLAGDLLPGATTEQKLATGFLRNHMINGEGGRIAEESRVEYVMDMAETTGTVWLGLTFNCCRCHDHKFDPLKQREYYSLFAFFNQTPVTGGGRSPQTPPLIAFSTPADEKNFSEVQAKADAATKELMRLEAKLFPRFPGKPATSSPQAKGLPKSTSDALRIAPARRGRSQLSELEKHYAQLNPAYSEKLKALGALVGERETLDRKIARVMVMEDMPKHRDSFIYEKGLYNKPGAKVTAGFPEALFNPRPGAAAPKRTEPMTRLDLAQWLVSSENPLTARVVVNRYWQQFFGIGLVKTVNDFGIQGERPGNPELLDWLAVEFREKGWSLKQFVRLIVTSATYRQSSRVTPQLAERDPDNRLLARGPRFRMPSWMLRDQALAASGLLVPSVGGKPVNPYQPPGVWEEATFDTKRYTQGHGDALYRRSVYTFWRRIVAPTVFFDSASRQTCSVKSSRTNSPLHALTTLNDVTFVEAARALAERVMLAEKRDDQRITLAVRRVLARTPTAEEARVLTTALTRLKQHYSHDSAAAKALVSVGESKRNEKLDPAEHAAYTAVCNLIFNLDEALTKE